MGFLKDFKEFAIKGNVIDLAVAVVVGGAFNKIVSSLVKDIIMPPLGILLGEVNFQHLRLVLKPAMGDMAEVAITYGQFIQNVVDFIIIAFSIFMIVRTYRRLERKKEETPAPSPVAPTNEEKLLAEIRDLLKERSS